MDFGSNVLHTAHLNRPSLLLIAKCAPFVSRLMKCGAVVRSATASPARDACSTIPNPVLDLTGLRISYGPGVLRLGLYFVPSPVVDTISVVIREVHWR